MDFQVQQTYAQQAKGWAERALEIVVQAFGNTGTAILLVGIFAFILWTRLKPKS